jgi:hypothetical protein
LTSIAKLPPMGGCDVVSKPHAGGHFVDLGQGAGVIVEYYQYKRIPLTCIAADETWRRKASDPKRAHR